MGAQKISQDLVSGRDRSDVFTDHQDLGKSGSIRFLVLNQVIGENYEEAIDSLKEFYNTESVFPTFRRRIERFVNHSIDLIFAIKAKKNFPGVTQLTRAKQQELRDRCKDHYNELVFMLKKIEKVEKDLQVEDARSTIYVIRAGWLAAIAVFLTWFCVEVFRGLAVTSFIVVQDVLGKALDQALNFIGM